MLKHQADKFFDSRYLYYIKSTASSNSVEKSWWENSNWFRIKAIDAVIQQPSADHPSAPTAGRNETPTTHSGTLRKRAFVMDDQDRNAPVQATGIQDNTSQVIEYGGQLETGDNPMLSSWLSNNANSSIHQSQQQQQQSERDVPGHATCYNRFLSSKRSQPPVVIDSPAPAQLALNPLMNAQSTSAVRYEPKHSDAQARPDALFAAANSQPIASLHQSSTSSTNASLAAAAAAQQQQSTTQTPAPRIINTNLRRLALQQLKGYGQEVASRLNSCIVLPLVHPQMFTHLGLSASRGCVLSGSSGVGKRQVVHDFA
jgi:hypothetical protein